MTFLSPEERVLMKVKRHWFTITLEASGLFSMFFIPLVLCAVIVKSDFEFLKISTGSPFLVTALFSMWALFVWLLFCKIWTDYILDIWIITDKSLIDVEQKGLFNREVSTLRLDKIQDISVHIVGIVPSFLKFGEIRVQTAGSSKEFVMRDIENPYLVKGLLLRLHDEMIEKNKTDNIQ